LTGLVPLLKRRRGSREVATLEFGPVAGQECNAITCPLDSSRFHEPENLRAFEAKEVKWLQIDFHFAARACRKCFEERLFKKSAVLLDARLANEFDGHLLQLLPRCWQCHENADNGNRR